MIREKPPMLRRRTLLLARFVRLEKFGARLVLVALAGGGENVKFQRRRLRLRVLGPGGRYSFGEANEDAQRRRRFREGILRR